MSTVSPLLRNPLDYVFDFIDKTVESECNLQRQSFEIGRSMFSSSDVPPYISIDDKAFHLHVAASKDTARQRFAQRLAIIATLPESEFERFLKMVRTP